MTESDEGSVEHLVNPDPVRLEVKDLSIKLAANGAEVVGDVSFSVRAVELLGLVGESGSGKTTVALALLGTLGGASISQRGRSAWTGRTFSN